MISIGCFLLLLGIIVSCFHKGADLFSPARVFGTVWLTCIGLADLKLSAFQHIWSTWAWSALLLGILSYLLGIFVMYILNLDKRIGSVASFRNRLEGIILISQKKYYGIVLCLFGLYILSYGLETLAFGGLPILSNAPDRARSEYGLFGVHLFVSMASSVLILCHEYFILFKKPRKYSAIILSVFFITFLSYGLLLQRFNYIMWLIIIFVLYYYLSKHVNAKNVLTVTSLVLLFLTFLQTIRVSRYVQNYIYVVSRMRFSVKYAFLAEPYMYIVMNLENFARGADKLEQYTYGYYSADSVFALSGLKHPVAEYFSLIERPFLNSGYNTFPFLWTYYRDFGILGMVICCFIIGLGISYLYYSFRIQPTPLKLIGYALSVFFMILSFFTNILGLLTVVFNIIVLLLTHYFMMIRKTKVGHSVA